MAIAGFWKTYFGKIPTFNGVSGLMHFHAIMVLLWLSILMAQPILILNKKVELHKIVDKASYFIVPLLLISIMLLMRFSFVKNMLPLNPNIDLRLVGTADLTFFIPCYLLPIYFRKKTNYYGRFNHL